MSYVGNTNTTQAFTPAVDYFSGDGSTVAFTLSRPVASVAQVQVVVNNVPQNPTDAFTVLNNTITFTSAPSSGTNNIYVQYTSPITQVIQPGQGTVGASQLIGGTVNTTADATLNGVSVGRGAGAVSTNTAVGASALAANTTGSANTTVGTDALIANTTSSYNTAVGFRAGFSGTTSVGYNTYLGYAAGYSATTNQNTFLGSRSGYNTTTGAYNVFVGEYTGYENTTGSGNTFVGSNSCGYAMTTGSKNTILGGFSGNQGGLDIRTASNYIVLSDGDGNPRLHHNGTAWLNLSGRRSNAHVLGNCQQWVGTVSNITNGSSFSLAAISATYDNLCYELDIFVNRGGYLATKYAGVFGYNGFTTAISTGDTTAAVLTKTGTLYNETMTITNSVGATVHAYYFSLRVWGLAVSSSVSTGGANLVTSSYLTRIE